MRLRVVFLKQCFSWMIHGELEDPSLEFFIQSKENYTKNVQSSSGHDNSTAASSTTAPLQDMVLRRLYQAKLDHSLPESSSNPTNLTSNMKGLYNHTISTGSFDWTSSYVLRLERIPSSHLTPRLASKIMFAGKAVKLLQWAAAFISQENGQKNINNLYIYLYIYNMLIYERRFL